MNRVFYILLFLTISGFGVLWWLFNSLPPEEEVLAPIEKHGLVIHEEKKAETPGAPGELLAHGEESKAETATAHETHEKGALIEGAGHVSTEAAESHGESAHSEATHSEAAHSEPAHESESKKSATVEKSSIFLETAPVGAMVYVDGVLKGKAPFTFELAATDKVVRIELPGYERTIEERHREAGALTRWKIDLVPQTEVAKEASFQKTDYRLTGTRGPLFIQLKAVDSKENTGWLLAIQSFREKLKSKNVYICDVDLGAKGRWSRFLVGPFAGKSEAQAELKNAQKLSGEMGAFVVGEQKCLE
jgi:hypothetical protein